MIHAPSLLRRPFFSSSSPPPPPAASCILPPPPLLRPHVISSLARTPISLRCSAADSRSPSNREMAAQQDPRLAGIASAIRVIPDFPKAGIMFQDITTLLLDVKAFRDTIDLFVDRYKDKGISVVAGEVISEEYSLEYGTDKIEMHVGAVEAGERALIVDDLIATGGTLNAAIRLLATISFNPFVLLTFTISSIYQGRDRLGDKPLFVLVQSSVDAHDHH
ncbi:unnamed protein product [Linum tenue]|uniref:adenine phosphoribosyltransferase n=1 Tax=Linum tenue TaxID=586396 RepID=A0AAV0MZL1_9ROSI|nr:unnamed protein product [Linum tenue]